MINQDTNSSKNSISSDIDKSDFNRLSNSDNLTVGGTKSSNTKSIYSAEPKRLKLNNTQFEVLFPFIPELEGYLNAFASFDKKEIVVEFGTYVDFLVDNLVEEKKDKDKGNNKMFIFEKVEEKTKLESSSIMNKEEEDCSSPILFSDCDLYTYSHKLKEILTMINDFIRSENLKEGRTLSSNEVNSRLTPRVKEKIRRTVIANPKIISDVWESFIMNIAILNIKSVILCGEYTSSKLLSSNVEVIPIKFVPKLGSELSVICKPELLTLDVVKNLLIVNDLGSDYDNKLLVNSLDSNEIENIFNYKLDGKNIYIPEIAERFGYTQERYSNAEEVIIKSASNSTVSLSDCNNYLDSLVEYIDSLGALYSELKFINEKDKCVILDFDFK